MASHLRSHWTLDPTVSFLNHGSFGACPVVVLEAQTELRARLEREPVRFFLREMQPLLDEARAALAAFLGADPEGLVFVPNATTGVSAVLRSLAFAAGDELLTTNHAYNACTNALRLAADSTGARVVVADVPFPLGGADEVLGAVLGAVTPRTRLALIDHVTSPTGLIFPLADLVTALESRGVPVLVDAAHTAGMVPVDVARLGAAFLTGNCHKWLCAPKGAGFLCVRSDLRDRIHPAVTSHGRNAPLSGRSRFHVEFDWPGTDDPTAWLCVPHALSAVAAMVPGGWPEVRARNRALALAARKLLAAALGVALPCPDDMIGSLAALPLPDGDGAPPRSPLYLDPLQDRMLFDHGIEVPVIPWPAPPRRLVRVSAQLYNDLDEYRRLAGVLVSLLREERSS
jgi:isopenicillin-N epimerase